MTNDITQLNTIRSHTLDEIETVFADPAALYTLEGQPVAWQEYLRSLRLIVDWCDSKLAEISPYEVRSAGR